MLTLDTLLAQAKEHSASDVHLKVDQRPCLRIHSQLAETDLPLVEVAERCGFKHREYLSAIFKAHLGKSPAEYRREVALRHPEGPQRIDTD